MKDISDKLPRMTAKRTFSTSSRVVSFRRADAPAPTGSSTTGIPFSLAVWPALTIDATVRAFSVPMFSTSALLMEVMSATSPMSSAMMGEPPQASSALATSFTVT